MLALLQKQKTTVKASTKVTTSQNQTDNTILGKASTEITLYNAKAKSTKRIYWKCNQKIQDSTKVKEFPVVHNFIDNKQSSKWQNCTLFMLDFCSNGQNFARDQKFRRKVTDTH